VTTSQDEVETRETAWPSLYFDHSDGGVPAGTHFRQFDELRESAPFFRSTAHQGWWAFTRADMIREAYQRTDLFSNSSVTVADPEPSYKWIPEMLDGAEHTKWRQLLAPYFSPAAVKKMETGVRRRCVELIDAFKDKGSCDFLNDFARKYPTTIFMELFGLPVSEADQFMAWEDMILHPHGEFDARSQMRLDGMMAVMGYFSSLVAERRADPRSDLISFVLASEIDGQPISDSDMISFCLLMFMAGLDTVAMQLCWSFLHLATHPNDRRRIVDDPSIIPSASEEFLRAFAFVVPSRKVLQDADFHGCPIKKGEMVLLPLCSATRDPRLFANGDEVIIDRSPNPHIAFGAGPHRCLGAGLARQELHIAYEEWHRAIPDYRVADGIELSEHGGQLGLDRLTLVWD